MEDTDNRQRKQYVFTYNNYTPAGEAALKEWLKLRTKYAIFGHEIAPSTGTPHLQGYFSLHKQARITTIINQLAPHGIKPRLEAAKGDAQSNYAYCTKADPHNYFEHGERRLALSGSRNDITAATDELKTKDLATVAFEKPEVFVKFSSGLGKWKSLWDSQQQPEERDITVTVYWGKGGTGKTQKAMIDARRLGIETYFLNQPNGQSLFWDNLQSQKGLILDDFYGWLKPHELFRILDIYKYQVNVKGSTAIAKWTHVWITSNNPPEQWYKPEIYQKLDQHAYHRRLHNIAFFDWVVIDEAVKPIRWDKLQKPLNIDWTKVTCKLCDKKAPGPAIIPLGMLTPS